MGYMSYNKIGKKCNGMRGFKLKIRRFSIKRLRAKFLFMFKFLRRWRSCCGKGIQFLIKKNVAKEKEESQKSLSGGNLVMEDVPYKHIVNDYRMKSYARSNSFYSEAIADCLDFIKRNSLSLDEKAVLQN
ncbi:hypothetical protein Leryth_006387 [Lithospermum erythrorhizon]|nr:hypothetical protein Leryth_006387 [Lithospermum erythrorhizon]